MKKSFLWLAIVLICGCQPSKKIAKARATLDKYEAGAAYCTVRFPFKDTTYVTIDSTHFDTLFVDREPITTIEYRSDTVFKTLLLPGTTRFITKYIKKDSIVIRPDSYKEADLGNQLRAAIASGADDRAQRDKEHKQKVRYLWIAIGLAFLWILYFVIGYFTRRIKTANKIINAVK